MPPTMVFVELYSLSPAEPVGFPSATYPSQVTYEMQDSHRTKWGHAIFNGTILNHCKIDLHHTNFFNLELIKANTMHVYNSQNIEMTCDEVEQYLDEKYPVHAAMMKKAAENRN